MMPTRLLIRLLPLFVACSAEEAPASESPPATAATADVTQVSVSGVESAYRFSVRVRSPDTGCDRYADWWEVVDAATGALLYRRILLHSHVSEQPFTRSGGPVPARADQVVVVRAHLNTGGYGVAQSGTAQSTFTSTRTAEGFGVDLETASPQPSDCAF
ncbi:MAG: hypothetical protein AAFZ18_22670 [Myxococcota bacterium]